MRIVSFGSGSIVPHSEMESGGIHPECCELLHIVSGRVDFQWTAQHCRADAPALFFVPPNTPHSLAAIDDEAAHRYLVFDMTELCADPYDAPRLDSDRWNELQSLEMPFAQKLFTDKIYESLDFINHLHLSGTASRHRDIARACEFEIGKILSLMAHLLASESVGPADGNPPARKSAEEAVVMMTDYMEWRYREPVTIEMLANLVHMNPSYAIRIFREHVGMTPTQYLQNLRIKASASFLIGSDMPIRTIAERTGFNSVHYFTRLFTKIYGDSPASWRSRLKQRQ